MKLFSCEESELKGLITFINTVNASDALMLMTRYGGGR